MNVIMRGKKKKKKKKKNKELCIQQEMHEKNSWQLKQAQQETTYFVEDHGLFYREI
jgi:hypothetical protein